jgi:adenylate cyclase class 2
LVVAHGSDGVLQFDEVAVLQAGGLVGLGSCLRVGVIGRVGVDRVVGRFGLFVTHTPNNSRATLKNHVSRRDPRVRWTFSDSPPRPAMYEVELKVRAGHEAVRERLSTLGATDAGAVRQVDTYYDAPNRDFAETDEALRIRREEGPDGATARVTYKGPLVETASKSRREVETGVDDADDLDAILDALGFSPAAVVEKERERYVLDDYTVTLDTVADLGEFVEIEREVPESDLEATRDEAVAHLRDLGLDPDEQIRTSYLGLLLDSPK